MKCRCIFYAMISRGYFTDDKLPEATPAAVNTSTGRAVCRELHLNVTVRDFTV